MEAIFGRIAFIGAGAMAEGLIRGLLGRGVPASSIWASDSSAERLELVHETLGVNAANDNGEAVLACATVILAVKPQILPIVLAQIGNLLSGRLVISIAAGISLATLTAAVPPGTPVIRAMPNTPCMISKGAIAITASSECLPSQFERARSILASSGGVVSVREELMDAVTGLSGSGPAYVYTFVEALIDAGVRVGLPRDIARQLAVDTVLGSVELLRQTGSHPALLRDAVTSPGGTTIAAMDALEAGGFRSAVYEAVKAAKARSVELGIPTEGVQK